MDKIVIINWKINVNYAQMNEFVERLDPKDAKSLIVLPSYVGLFLFSTIIQNKISPNQLGFQYVNSFARGDYTGDVSYLEAKEVGVEYILINHNDILEYRKWDKKYNIQNHKIKKLIENEMVPIICIGNDIKDTFEEIDKLVKNEVVKLFNDVRYLDNSKFIFNYMPNFVVKNSIILSNNEVERQIDIVKSVLLDVFGEYAFKNSLKVVYGGKLFDKQAIPNNIDGIYIDDGQDFNYVNNILFLLKETDDDKNKDVDLVKNTEAEELKNKEMNLRNDAVENINNSKEGTIDTKIENIPEDK